MGFANFVKFRIEDYKLMRDYYPDISAFKKLTYCWKKYQYQKKYNFAHVEFFELNLGERKEKEDVAKIYPRKLQAELYRKVNPESMWAVTKDKFASYIALKDFYKREACGYNPSPNSFVKEYYAHYDWKNAILQFLNSHDNYIIKPLAEACGRGVRIVHKEMLDEQPEVLLNSYMQDYPDGFIIEELIRQHDFIAQFNPDSVNTIRVICFNLSECGKDVEVKYPYLRIGRHGSFVDNISNGGIGVLIDKETGNLGLALDGRAILFSEHPDSHIKFEGEMPLWNDFIETAMNVAKAMPKLKIAGLDLALDQERGWTLVEINVEPEIGIPQAAAGCGIRDYMEKFAQALGV